MDELKSNVKSKLDKYAQRIRKARQATKVVVISDSDNQQRSIVGLQKDKQDKNSLSAQKQVPITVQQHSKPNMFNLLNLKKRVVPICDMVGDEEQIRVVENENAELDEVAKSSMLRNLFTYQRQGSNSTCYTSLVNIREKMTESSKPKHRLAPIVIDQDNQNQANNQHSNNQDDKRTRKKTPRYFETARDRHQPDASYDSDSEEIITCFRCKGEGHIARNCPNEAQKTKCTFCLGGHHFSECDSNLCFKCGDNSHMAEVQNCPKKGSRCRKCNKVGHLEKQCGNIVFLDYHSRQQHEINERYQKSDMKNLRCLLGQQCKQQGKGHFNCFKYLRKGLMPYQKIPRTQRERIQQARPKNNYLDKNNSRGFSEHRQRQEQNWRRNHNNNQNRARMDFREHRQGQWNRRNQRQRSYRK